MFISERDEQIFHTLGFKVRLMTFDQVATTWWNDTRSGLKSAKKRLSLLIKNKYLKCLYVHAQPIIEIKGPVYTWTPPSGPPPDAISLSTKFKNRLSAPPQVIPVFILTQKCANLIGGIGGKLLNHLHATHDLHVSEVYVFLLKNDLESANAWVGEDFFNKRGKGLVDPDAIIKNSPETFVEFCGKYDAQRIIHFHKDCQNNNKGYQLW